MRIERVWVCFGLFGVGGGGHPPRPAHIPPRVTAGKWPNLRVSIKPPQPKTNFRENILCGYCTVFRKWGGGDRRLVPGQYLRAKVDSGVQSRVYMCSQLWKSAGTNGQNFSVCRCRPKWPAHWPKVQVECGATKTVINSARPMAPAVPRAPRASPPAIPVAGSGLAPFRHFFFGLLGGTCAQGPQQGFSTLRVDPGGVWGRKGAVPL